MSSTGSSISEAMAAVVQRVKANVAVSESDPQVAARLERLAEEGKAEVREEARIRREEAWSLLGIPRRHWPMLHASACGESGGAEDSAAMRAVGPFTGHAEKALLLVLAGGVGTGKTVATSFGCAFNAGRFMKAIDLVRIGLFDNDGALPALARARLLAIDDMGMEPIDAKGYGYAALYDVLDRRYDAALKTIITTNLTVDQFRERYGSGAGARLWDRIREVGIWVDVPGASLRKSA